MPPGEWIVDAYRDGKRFVVRAAEKLTALFETEITGSRRHRRQSPKVRLQRSNYAIVDHLGELNRRTRAFCDTRIISQTAETQSRFLGPAVLPLGNVAPPQGTVTLLCTESEVYQSSFCRPTSSKIRPEPWFGFL